MVARASRACRVDSLVDVRLLFPGRLHGDIDTTVDAARLEARATTENITFVLNDALH